MSEKRVETWFDTLEGSLIVGEPALEQHLMGFASIIVRFEDLIDAPEFSYKRGDFDKADTSNWTNDDYLSLGKWLLGFLPNQLHKYHLERLYILGLGPEPDTYKAASRFGSFTAFQREVGVDSTERTAYQSWGLSNFVDLAKSVYAEAGRRPRDRDYNLKAEARKTPGGRYLNLRFGGIKWVNELIGFPDYSLWEEQDYIDWALNVLAANPGRRITQDTVEELSKTDRGPSYRQIANFFNGPSNFAEKVEKARAADNRSRGSTAEEAWRVLNERFSVEDAILPYDFENMSYAEQNNFFSHYLLAKTLLGDSKKASIVAAHQVVSSDPYTYIEILRQMDPSIRLINIQRLSSEFGTAYPTPVWGLGIGYLRVA